MFTLKDPSSLEAAWILSSRDEYPVVSIPRDITISMTNYHIMGVQFLYGNYRKKLKGAILNEDIGMNFPLQVAAFLWATSSNYILVICQDQNVCTWHYHLTHYGKFDTIIITEKNCEKFIQDENQAIIIKFSNIKLLESVLRHEFSTVVVDDFDEIANKLIFRKLTGDFHIGLTTRNFYQNPNQKIQWHMLNWSNPGCVGKLSKFYKIDSENFSNFRDNYRLWWCRLTWRFCESFKKPSEKDNENFCKTLREWSKQYELDYYPSSNNNSNNKESRKRKNLDIVHRESRKSKSSKTKKIPIYIKESDQDSNSSNDTIIMDNDSVQMSETYVKLPSMDETPMISSIIRNLNKSPLPKVQETSSSKSCKKTIVQSATTTEGTELNFQQTEPTKSSEKDSSEEFLNGLIYSSQPTTNIYRNLDAEIQQVLMEADALLLNAID